MYLLIINELLSFIICLNKNITINLKTFYYFKILFLIFIIISILLNDILKSNLVIKYSKHKSDKKLINIPKNGKNQLLLKEKKELLKFISNNTGKNITSVKSIFINNNFNFGNQFILLNKAIFYCEILGCKRIILDKKNFWYIKNKIINKKFKMIIKAGIINNILNPVTIIDNTLNFFYYNYIIKPEYRAIILKEEILKNLPKITIKKNDLFIYIRSGDIFTTPNINYSQPPLCFYKTILKNYKFKDIYIIAQNKNNPVIDKLINQFPNIIYNENKLKIDISYLIKGYNIVKAPSTFLESIIQLNNNMEFLWEFDFNSGKEEKFNSLNELINSFSIPKKKLISYRMKAANSYKREMKYWNNTQAQRDIMIKGKCPFNFSIIYKK